VNVKNSDLAWVVFLLVNESPTAASGLATDCRF
jgi:hypothetical protein